MTSQQQWRTKWGYKGIAVTESRPGIWRLRTGGFLVRGRVTSPRSGQRLQFLKQLPDASLREAEQYRLDRIRELQDQVHGRAAKKIRFSKYAASLFERKVKAGDIRSAKTRERWEDSLTWHILPALGEFFVSELKFSDVSAFRDWLGERVFAADEERIERELPDGTTKLMKKKIAPSTANGFLSILRVICVAMVAEHELPRNPAAGINDFDLSEHPTYTDEEPNALTIDWAGKFLAAMREKRPAHYAMSYLGFITGLRPSSLRPLRRKEDIDWEKRTLKVRRSNSIGDEIMQKTKTGRQQTIHLPPEAIDILREHLALIDSGKNPKMKASPYLFPSRIGGMRTRSVLDKPFVFIAKHIGLPIHLTPRGMRRTFQDLARGAGVHDVVTRSISGHSTERMQSHYSTAAADEQRSAIAKVISMVDRKKASNG